mgnify:CR=1 FL=1
MTTLLDPGCGDGDCYGCCGCFLLPVLESGAVACEVAASVRLVYRCDDVEIERSLIDFGVMARVTGDGVILWEGLAADLPPTFSAELATEFELYVWATIQAESYGPQCNTVAPSTTYFTADPACRNCGTPACTCVELDDGLASVPSAVVTISGATPTPTTIDDTDRCDGTVTPNPPGCPSISGTYVVTCALPRTFNTVNPGPARCDPTGGGASYDIFYYTSVSIVNAPEKVTVKLGSILGTSGHGQNAVDYQVIVEFPAKYSYEFCEDTVGGPVMRYSCELGDPVLVRSVAPTQNGCNLTGLTVSVSR